MSKQEFWQRVEQKCNEVRVPYVPSRSIERTIVFSVECEKCRIGLVSPDVGCRLDSLPPKCQAECPVCHERRFLPFEALDLRRGQRQRLKS